MESERGWRSHSGLTRNNRCTVEIFRQNGKSVGPNCWTLARFAPQAAQDTRETFGRARKFFDQKLQIFLLGKWEFYSQTFPLQFMSSNIELRLHKFIAGYIFYNYIQAASLLHITAHFFLASRQARLSTRFCRGVLTISQNKNASVTPNWSRTERKSCFPTSLTSRSFSRDRNKYGGVWFLLQSKRGTRR